MAYGTQERAIRTLTRSEPMRRLELEMCMSFPGQVVAVGEGSAAVAIDGRTRNASTLLHPEVRVGDWVLVSVGTIIECLTDAQAADITATLREAMAQS
jgi:hydrogenase assembly chaperone HypC/HupF